MSFKLKHSVLHMNCCFFVDLFLFRFDGAVDFAKRTATDRLIKLRDRHSTVAREVYA
jgi:hypothetical protein